MDASGSNPSPEKDQPSGSPYPPEVSAVERRHRILIVEDNLSDVFLMREAIKATLPDAELHTVHDGEKAIRFFEAADNNETAPCPDLVILDINLPKKNGGDVLRYMRNTRRCAHALVLVATSSNSAADRAQMAELGANTYFRKPSDYEEFFKLGAIVKTMLDGIASGGSGDSQDSV